LGIQVKIVEPGMIATDFSECSFDFRQTPTLPPISHWWTSSLPFSAAPK
jgi:hypothetical protein